MARADDGMARVGHDVSVIGCKGVRRSVQIVAAGSAAGPGLGRGSICSFCARQAQIDPAGRHVGW